MRRATILVLVGCVHLWGGIVQKLTHQAAVGTAVSSAFGTANTAGNTLVIMCGAWNAAASPPTLSVTDTAGDSFTQIESDNLLWNGSSSSQGRMWEATAVGGTNTVTCHGSVSGDPIHILGAEYAPLGVLDRTSHNTIIGSSTVSSGSITPTGNGTAVSFFWNQSGGTTLSSVTGVALEDYFDDTTNGASSGWGDASATSGTGISAAWTVGATNQNLMAFIVNFKAAVPVLLGTVTLTGNAVCCLPQFQF